MKDIIDVIGKPAMLEGLAEEAAELAQAALKLARNLRGENPSDSNEIVCTIHLAEEIADVEWYIDQLAGVFDITMVENLKEYKHQRACKRLGLASQDDSDHLGKKVKVDGFLS